MNVFAPLDHNRGTSTGSLVIKNSSSTSLKQMASAESNSSGEARNENGDNRLAPYNPTHATAQSAALDLLKLTPRDVFFDLGCGDGRLIVAALERCYDDDFLMKVHQERFARMHLQEEVHPLKAPPKQKQPRVPPSPSSLRKPKHLRHRSGNSVGSRVTIHHTRSHSSQSGDCSVPHLMLSPHDDGSEDTSNISGVNSEQEGKRMEGSDRSGDVLSALSPSSSNRQILSIVAPNSPETPLVSNTKDSVLSRGSRQGGGLLPPPRLAYPVNKHEGSGPSHPATPQAKRELGEEKVPQTIETLSPEEASKGCHAPQISELPVDGYSFYADQALATVPSGDRSAHESEEDEALRSWERSPSNGKSEDENKLGGLRCVGVEYNQALAEQARENLANSYVYPHAEGRVHVRWGDVLDEWAQSPGDGKEDASKLTLLDDASAVFVYLLPQGLLRVRPLLREAAARRHRAREDHRRRRQRQKLERLERERRREETELRRQQEREWQALQHPLRCAEPLRQLRSVGQTELSSLTDSQAFPLPRAFVHHKDISRISDITDYDFPLSSPRGSLGDERKLSDVQRSSLDEDGRGTGEEDDGDDDQGGIPPFRVASYMFSVPGWTPLRVDRGSKGGCPVYLYEDVHEEDEG